MRLDCLNYNIPHLNKFHKPINPFFITPPARERSQGTVRWMRSIREDLDGVTRIILVYRGQQELAPCLPGEGQGLGAAPQA